MKAAIDVLKTYKQRKIAILGDMLELGEYSKKNHIEVGQYIEKNKIDILIVVGKESKNYKEGALREGFNANSIYEYKSVNSLKDKINDILIQGDVILLKGSRGSKMEEVLNIISG